MPCPPGRPGLSIKARMTRGRSAIAPAPGWCSNLIQTTLRLRPPRPQLAPDELRRRQHRLNEEQGDVEIDGPARIGEKVGGAQPSVRDGKPARRNRMRPQIAGWAPGRGVQSKKKPHTGRRREA